MISESSLKVVFRSELGSGTGADADAAVLISNNVASTPFDPPPSRVQTKAQEIGILFQIPCNPPARDGGAHFRYSDPPYYLNPSHPVSL